MSKKKIFKPKVTVIFLILFTDLEKRFVILCTLNYTMYFYTLTHKSIHHRFVRNYVLIRSIFPWNSIFQIMYMRVNVVVKPYYNHTDIKIKIFKNGIH